MSEPIATRVIAELVTARRHKKISAQKLADEMTAAGYPVKRSVIANLETGRREEISVGYLAIAAQVLGIDAAAILRRSAPCPRCRNEPPTGFACITCGAES